ncbi:helix-turn-helix transcriptional regulator [Micromonospora chalcea]|uniref:helix-turn-helix domain-containing protein n=1 Tax=Micromonospora chalcea TaxID=1874 RepID=UPI0033F25BB1
MTVETMPRNERLSAALEAANLSYVDVATRVNVDPKTVERWVSCGRTPYPRHAHQLARLLKLEPDYLFPTLGATRRTVPTAGDELIACYPGRGAVPVFLWEDLLTRASRRVDIMGDLGLADMVRNLPDVLAAKAATGIPVRVIVTDPDTATNPADHARLIAVNASYRPLVGTPNVTLAHYPGPLTTTVVRLDDDVLVRTSIDGCPMALAPILHLRHLAAGPLARLYLTSLECVADASLPWAPVTGLRAVA